ncbi:hypothetical protein N0V85_003997 [Neurospora sp. IMI 360204]|nr:hypothetical protein N0V85_003997 [Neurospora sp. IMI 360204]
MPYHILLSILISLLAITPHANANPHDPGAGLDNRNPQWYYGHPNHHTNTHNPPPTTTIKPTTATITPPTIISVNPITTVEETIDLSFSPSTTTTIYRASQPSTKLSTSE